jgi:hypothetical protein
MTIDEAFDTILHRNKNKEPCSASAVEIQAECGASIEEINVRMRERYKNGEIGYYRAINGIRFIKN